MKQRYMPIDENSRLVWLANFVTKFSSLYYNSLGGFTTSDAIQCTNDLAFYTFLINFKATLRSKTTDWVAYVQLASNGHTGVAALGPIPVMPVLPTTLPTVVLPDIFGRIALLVARIKLAPNYTPAIGMDLGIIGADDTTNVNTMKPVLDITLQAGHPNLGWVKHGMQGIDIYVDRGGGVFVFLARDTEPDYLDTAALPAAGQSAVWRYKAIYILHDAPCGQWSDVVSVSVMGCGGAARKWAAPGICPGAADGRRGRERKARWTRPGDRCSLPAINYGDKNHSTVRVN